MCQIELQDSTGEELGSLLPQTSPSPHQSIIRGGSRLSPIFITAFFATLLLCTVLFTPTTYIFCKIGIKPIYSICHGDPIAASTESINGHHISSAFETLDSEIAKSQYKSSILKKDCNIYKGKWIKDEEYPLYKPELCPFIAEKFNCYQNGRSDSAYTRWRWQPDDCNLPRFDGRYFLEKLRGKRLALVGDSLNRNQWESVVCMLYQALPDKRQFFVEIAPDQTERKAVFQDFNFTVEFYKSRFLVNVEEVSSENDFILDLDMMDKRADTRWKNADVLVFNTGHWWSPYKLGNGDFRYREAGVLIPKLDMDIAYTKALSTWAHWVDQQVNPENSTVFFRTLSPDHFKGGPWNDGGYCDDETQPFLDEPTSVFNPTPKRAKILNGMLEKMRFPVHKLNISHLSDYRKDAHPSIYWSPEKKQHQDCRHWCLPGLPDTWNELLFFEYAVLIRGD